MRRIAYVLLPFRFTFYALLVFSCFLPGAFLTDPPRCDKDNYSLQHQCRRPSQFLNAAPLFMCRQPGYTRVEHLCMLRFMVSCSLAFHVQPYLPILDSFLLAVIILVYDDLYGTDPCSMAMLGMYTHASMSDYSLFTRFFTTSLQGYWNAGTVSDRPSQHHCWEAGYRIPGRFSLTLTMGDNNSSLTTGAALVVIMVTVEGRTISTT